MVGDTLSRLPVIPGRVILSIVPPMKPLTDTVFLTSSPAFTRLPPDNGAEAAFAGRSNAGKSSVLNVLTGRKNLAGTSSTPGKTRSINLFAVPPGTHRRLVDLPGYGYAKTGMKERELWGRELTRYITERRSLKGVIIVVDIRRGITELDRSMLTLCRSGGRAVHVLLNKSDKLKPGRTAAAVKQVEAELRSLAPSAAIGTFSALKREGRPQLLGTITAWLTHNTDETAELSS